MASRSHQHDLLAQAMITCKIPLQVACACRLGPDLLAQAMVAALGGCNAQLVDLLLEETQALVDDYSGSLKVKENNSGFSVCQIQGSEQCGSVFSIHCCCLLLLEETQALMNDHSGSLTVLTIEFQS